MVGHNISFYGEIWILTGITCTYLKTYQPMQLRSVKGSLLCTLTALLIGQHILLNKSSLLTKYLKASYLGHYLSPKAYLMLFVDSGSIHWILSQAFVELPR